MKTRPLKSSFRSSRGFPTCVAKDYDIVFAAGVPLLDLHNDQDIAEELPRYQLPLWSSVAHY